MQILTSKFFPIFPVYVIYISYLLLFICMNGIKSKGSIRYAQVERILFIDTGYEKKWFSKIFERWAYKTILILS